MILSGFNFSIIASNPRKNILRHSWECIAPTVETATTEPGIMPSKQKSKLSISAHETVGMTRHPEKVQRQNFLNAVYNAKVNATLFQNGNHPERNEFHKKIVE